MTAPIWLLVLGCGVSAQALKLLIYSVVNRRFDASLAAQSCGLPSLQSVVLGCLLTAVVLKTGWRSPESSFALVFAVVAVHDTVKLRRAFTAQREVVYRLVTAAGPGRPEAVAGYLDPLSHHPAHVAAGLVYGALFALAFGVASG